MAFITLDAHKLKSNFDFLNTFFKEQHIDWSVVTKILCGNKKYLAELLNMGISQYSDSRISNLKVIKSIDKNAQTIYIKPPAKGVIREVIKYADISMNTDFRTIKMLSKEAQKQGVIHKIIIMIDLGELREGVMREDFVDFYSRVFEMKNIEIIGLGTNLSCLYGILPNNDKLIQLSLYKQLVEAKFNVKIPFISGGSSVTIPLVSQGLMPKGINHFRVGETLFMGTDVYNSDTFEGMENNIFKLYAEIIELYEKPIVPTGELGTNLEGEEHNFDEEDYGKTTMRAIIDIGLLDIDMKHLDPSDESIKYAGATSDMVVLDLSDNSKDYKVGDLIEFTMDYMGIVRIMNSKYIEKRIVNVATESPATT
ncbi:alanine racemase [Flavobacterium litorale]|uniref:Alanine/ornithine racemase family PLP-dependent enzyme n=1 Tax=Flavobacterium litorale TaxID=2856519 RepID=A0ABX8V665_9FLAO|nr:alanine/ornithine racemase family PLP-dependent enzyme [Flavobacterium litorale]QYJ68317.1 alanine/ornithine racemase family PLP-dependent enzyme [Flavobacterium litorale]